MLSNAVGLERISRIVGYKLTGGNFAEVSPNLPQRIAVLGQANTANQSGLNVSEGTQLNSAKEAGELFGYGSPIHMAMRILKPVFSDGVGGIPVIVYPQLAAVGSSAKELELTVVGTATKNATHNVVIAGRYGIDGDNYSFNVQTGDTATVVAAKIVDSINAVLSSPFTATSALGVVTLVSKWKDLNANLLNATVDNNNESAGLTYAVASTVPGAGTTSDLSDSLELFGSDWNTIVVNTYDTNQDTLLDELEVFNGRPDATSPTGRYQGVVMKPFIALTGFNDNDLGDLETLTDPRKDEVTNAICLAPGTDVLPLEIASSYALLFARISQDTPHLDIAGSYLQDIPVNRIENTLDSQSYDFRDSLVKIGASTVLVTNGKYQVQDFVTTYRPVGESVPQYRYCRNLMLDYNVRFGYYLLEQINVLDHAIVGNDDTVSAVKTIKPKQWVSILNEYADQLSLRALIADPSFMQASIQVALSSSNPDRLETFFRYKRSGIVRISSTTAEAGFNFGIN